MKGNIKTILFYVVLIGVVLFMASYSAREFNKDKLHYSDVYNYFAQERVRYFSIDKDSNLTLQLRTGDAGSEAWDDEKKDEVKKYRLLDYELFKKQILETFVYEQYNTDGSGTIEWYDLEEPPRIYWWVQYLPYLVMIIIFVALWIIMMNQATGGRGSKLSSFGKAHTKGIGDHVKTRFTDVAGCDEEKEELREVVEFLRNPDRFTKLGAKIPRGVLLVGPPGTGKTLLAKAVAGEAGVPFYSISGSDFVEMYVGVGASRVRDLFDTARKNPASIVFIDEIDAVGRHRGAGLGGGHDEREQTLNQLLVEMDGFGGNEGVIVMAATNRPDILDPALLRPGRFDRQITVNYPDINGREEILKVHARGKPFEKDVDLKRVAQTTVGFTGADLANLLNEAALIAARKRKLLIGMNDIEEASLKIIVGTPKKSMKIREHEKRNTAYHEAGHAIVAFMLPSLDPVSMISVIPSGKALGYTLTPPVEDKYNLYRNAMKEEIAMMLGGRAAEALVFDDISAGASNDIQRATALARKMVTRFGMSEELGPVLYGSEHGGDEVFLGRDFSNDKNYSEETAYVIDKEIERIVNEGYETAKRLLTENRDKLDFIAAYLIKNETMDDAQFRLTMEENPTIEQLEDMVAEKKRKSEEENAQRRKKEEEERREYERDFGKRFADSSGNNNSEESNDGSGKEISEKSDKDESNL